MRRKAFQLARPVGEEAAEVLAASVRQRSRKPPPWPADYTVWRCSSQLRWVRVPPSPGSRGCTGVSSLQDPSGEECRLQRQSHCPSRMLQQTAYRYGVGDSIRITLPYKAAILNAS